MKRTTLLVCLSLLLASAGKVQASPAAEEKSRPAVTRQPEETLKPEPVKEQPEETLKPEREPEPQQAAEQSARVVEQPAREAEQPAQAAEQPAQAVTPPASDRSDRPDRSGSLVLGTNLLYDAFLLPTLGVEWRVNRNIGVKLDGSYSYWGDEKGKVQKIWLVNPEVRWYLLDAKRFYVGASGNFGEYNIYKGMVGGLFSDDTGYQGKLWGAGLTVGYQLPFGRAFALNFNLGLGYTRFEYDSFNMIDGVRVYKDKGQTKNFWGPTQAGISFVWTIGGNK